MGDVWLQKAIIWATSEENNRIIFGFRPTLGPMHLGLKTDPLWPLFCTRCRSPVSLTKFQMAPTPSTLMSSGSKKKEPRYTFLRQAKASHSPKICTEVSSSVPHFLQVVLLLSPITCRCLLKVSCPVTERHELCKSENTNSSVRYARYFLSQKHPH